jgi:hypothetical protein
VQNPQKNKKNGSNIWTNADIQYHKKKIKTNNNVGYLASK